MRQKDTECIILTVTELYDESGKPLPIPSGTF